MGSGALLLLCAMPSAPASAAEDGYLDVGVAYTGEFWRNLDGGLRTDGAYLDDLHMRASLDGDRVMGWQDMRMALSARYNNRQALSQNIVGDSHGISNIDVDGSLRLYEAWLEQDFGRGSIKAGIIDLSSEFDVNEIGSVFVNGAHGTGPDFSQVGEQGPSIFPTPGLGLRGRVTLTPNWTIRVGIFEGVPGDPDYPRRTVIRLGKNEGALVLAEAEFRADDRFRFVLGYWRHEGRDHGDPGVRTRSDGVYALVEGRIARMGDHEISGFGRMGLADPDVQQFVRYHGAGLTISGPILTKGGAPEAAGLAIGAIRNGDRFFREQLRFGDPYDRHEFSFELTYRIEPTHWLALQPNVQYVINPGMSPDLGDAFVAGIRFQLTFGDMG